MYFIAECESGKEEVCKREDGIIFKSQIFEDTIKEYIRLCKEKQCYTIPIWTVEDLGNKSIVVFEKDGNIWHMELVEVLEDV